MRPDIFKAAWQQTKLTASMQIIDHAEILLMIEGYEGAAQIRKQRIAVNLAIFFLLTMICQGG